MVNPKKMDLFKNLNMVEFDILLLKEMGEYENLENNQKEVHSRNKEKNK